ncbi:MAG: FecR domain-containing protein [Nannocystaceae bacterium]
MTRPKHEADVTHYGCLEFHSDTEAVLCGRIHPRVHARYLAHMHTCTSCRQAHQLTEAIYRGPRLPSAQSSSDDHEFRAILARVSAPTSASLLGPVLVGCMVAIATLVATILGVPAQFDEQNEPLAAQTLVLPESEDASPFSPAAATSGLGHRAQADYGRVVGGHARLSTDDHEIVATNTFEVGTRVRVAANETAQLGLIGKILTNLGPLADLTWTDAQPRLIELELNRGMLAVRYDRRGPDPILKIHTPSALIHVTGTIFTLAVADDGATSVSVLRGEVKVLDPRGQRLIAEVAAGYRFDVDTSTYGDVGRVELIAALPLSDESSTAGANPAFLADGRVPATWVVPGLPDDPERRTLEHLVPAAQTMMPSLRIEPRKSSEPPPTPFEDEGEELIEILRRDLVRSRRAELQATLRRCHELYQSPHSRYMAARCITEFMYEHGDDRDVVEGWLLYGILRMDYGNDYPAAESAFRKFLDRAPPRHPQTEMAMYRRWLASTESGHISAAKQRAREYLRRFPNGKYIGKILQRFPKLVDEL